jgi:hypothetical protein
MRIIEKAFNIINKTIDNMTIIIIFSYYKLNFYKEIIKEQ